MGFELMTSSLPRMRSTPELHRLTFERGRRIELPFPAWKAGIIAIIRTPLFREEDSASALVCGRRWTRTTEPEGADLQSAAIAAMRSSQVLPDTVQGQFGADRGIRTLDPEITNHVLWPTELYRQYFKPFLQKDCKDRDYLRFSKKFSIFFVTEFSSIPQRTHSSSLLACLMNSSGMPIPSTAGASFRPASSSATAP